MRKLLPYLHDFIQLILQKRIELRSVIVFGSFVEGRMSKESDIDVQVVVRYSGDKGRVLSCADTISKKLQHDGFLHHLSVECTTTPDPTHSGQGIMLWGTPIRLTVRGEGLVQKHIVTYDTTTLPQQQRAALSRRLFGYSLRQGQKTYSFEGVVDGKKLRNALVLDADTAHDVVSILKTMNAPHHDTKMFLRPHAKFEER